MRVNLLFLVAFFLNAVIAQAQEPRRVTLQEAIELSIKNSGNLKIASARIDEAVALSREARDRKLPDVKISGSYLRVGGADVDIKTKSNNGNQNGGSAGSTAPNVNQALYGIANASLPLYAGGRIRYGIESAEYLEQAARLDAESDREAVIYNTIQAYTNLYKAGAATKVIEQSLRASNTRDTLFSRLEANGLLARNDLLKARLQTSNIELSLLDAQNNAAIANVNMDLLLGLPEGTEIVTDSNFAKQQQPLQPFPEAEAAALKARKDVQALDLRGKAGGLVIRSARAEKYPSVALTGGYIAADIPKFITITNAVNIGIGVQYNLASLWKANTKLAQAQARQTQLLASQSMLSDRIRLEVNRDYQNYLLAKKKIDVYRKGIAQAQENYRITKNKYDNALVTITELLDADVLLLQARLNVAGAEADAALAYYKLLETTGSL